MSETEQQYKALPQPGLFAYAGAWLFVLVFTFCSAHASVWLFDLINNQFVGGLPYADFLRTTVAGLGVLLAGVSFVYALSNKINKGDKNV